MGKIFAGLKKYYDEMSEEKLADNAKKLSFLNDIGPDALEYVENVRSYFYSEMLCQDYCIPKSRENTEIYSNQPYYLAA